MTVILNSDAPRSYFTQELLLKYVFQMSHFYLPRFIQERLAIVEGIGGIFWFVEIFARLRLRFMTEVCFLGHCLIHRGLS